MGRRVFFKKYFLLLSLLIGLILIAGFSLGVKKVRANYGSSICKFFCTSIVKIPPSPPPPEYTIRKVAMPSAGREGDYGFASGERVRYVVTITNNLQAPKYQNYSFDFEGDIDKSLWSTPTSESPTFIKMDDGVNSYMGITFRSSESKACLRLTLPKAIGPAGGELSFKYYGYGVRFWVGRGLFRDFGAIYDTTWQQASLSISSGDPEKTLDVEWCASSLFTDSYTLPFLYIDDVEVKVTDAMGVPVGTFEDPLPVYAGRDIFEFLPNRYPSKDGSMKEGRRVYDSVGSIVYDNIQAAMWAEGPYAPEKGVLRELVYKPLKLCSDFMSGQGYPTPPQDELNKISNGDKDAIAESDPNALCLEYPYPYDRDKKILKIRNIRVPYPTSGGKNTIFIVYSFKVL